MGNDIWLVVCLVALAAASRAQQRDASQQSCDADVDAHVFGRLSHNATGHWSATATLQRTLHAQDSDLQMEAIPRVWRVNGATKQSISITIRGRLLPLERERKNTKVSRRSVYMVHEEPETWERAKSICEEENAHLLILNSQQEADEILQLLKQYPNIRSGIPIGITDKEKEGEWKTIFGEYPADAGYNIWNANELDGGIKENCVYVWYEWMSYYDWRCNEQKTSFVCEKIVGYW